MSSDYSKWPMKAVNVTNLLLDAENPRIPATDKEMSQRELIAELVRHDNVYELAKSIAENGYFPNEVLVTFISKSDGKRYVVEGNRRAAAVKCLASPDTAPDEYRSKFAKLAADIDSKSISKVFALTAPSRKAAIPLLLDRHTHRQIESWSRTMQAQFSRRLQEKGMTIEQIAGWSRKNASEVRGLLIADVPYTAACSLEPEMAMTNLRAIQLTMCHRVFEINLLCDLNTEPCLRNRVGLMTSCL